MKTNDFASYLVMTLLASAIWLLNPASTIAQEFQSTCLAVAQNPESRDHAVLRSRSEFPLLRASFQTVASPLPHATITFVGHSTFRIESPEGVVIATDFAGNYGRGGIPNVVTMNNAHDTHFTSDVPKGVQHVLQGWQLGGTPAKHAIKVGDTYIRNVTTDLHFGSGVGEADGNSIFIFEMAGLCIGHVGHLHHELADEHYAAIGRLDVLMVPVDGSYTMSQNGMIKLAKRLRASIVLPMHYFSFTTLNAFLEGMSSQFTVEKSDSRSIDVSLTSLPKSPAVISLRQF